MALVRKEANLRDRLAMENFEMKVRRRLHSATRVGLGLRVTKWFDRVHLYV